MIDPAELKFVKALLASLPKPAPIPVRYPRRNPTQLSLWAGR
jgi:hypothetical protein